MKVIWNMVWVILGSATLLFAAVTTLDLLGGVHKRICNRFGDFYGAVFSGLVIGLILSFVGLCIDYLG
jgi:hypothetical protein